MKKVVSIALFVVLSHLGVAQTSDEISLLQLNKVELSKIYLSEVNRVIKKLPHTAFDSTLVDVPSTKYTQKKFEEVSKITAKSNEILLEEYAEIVPYADKQKIVKAIIYLRTL